MMNMDYIVIIRQNHSFKIKTSYYSDGSKSFILTIGNFLIDDLEFLNEDVSSSAMVTEPHITSPPPIVDFELEADATRLNSTDHDNAGEVQRHIA